MKKHPVFGRMWAKNTIIDVQNTLQYLLQNISLQTVQNLSTEIDLFAISRVRGSVNNFIIMIHEQALIICMSV